MNCRSCGRTASTVTKTVKVGGLVRRYRRCLCGFRFQTMEIERANYLFLLRLRAAVYETRSANA